MERELFVKAFEAGSRYANECFCGKCDYCLTSRKPKALNFDEWYKSNVPQPERTAEEFIKSKYPQDYDDIPKWHLEDMHEYAVQGIDWPSEEESNKILDKKAFRVPYDGSDNFYDESFIEGWKACYEWFLKRLKK